MRAIEIRRFANDTMLGFHSASDFRKADGPISILLFFVLCGCLLANFAVKGFSHA
jgi:hypothetical protein